MKSILKFFLPKPETFANIAAETICRSINKCDAIKKMAEYSEYAKLVTEIQQQIVNMLEDGTLDKDEEKRIAEMLTPIFNNLIKMI